VSFCSKASKLEFEALGMSPPYASSVPAGNQFTCFTSAKVLALLLQKYLLYRMSLPHSSLHARRYSLDLLYKYKSTNTDTSGADSKEKKAECFNSGKAIRYEVYLLYWNKSANTDAAAGPSSRWQGNQVL
jgi:hypothetical protein